MTNFIDLVWALAQSPLLIVIVPVIIGLLVMTHRAERDLHR